MSFISINWAVEKKIILSYHVNIHLKFSAVREIER